MDRAHAHRLIDQLGPSQLDAVTRLLEVMAAPQVDDEPRNAAEEEAVAKSKAWFEHNEGISFEDVVAECGLTMDEVTERATPR